jgi:TIR domain
MKIFLSWSGDRSKLIAETLRAWLPKVIQAIHPWMSSLDIDRGAKWNNEISSELSASRFGIICLTSENLEKPWINFEAGALAKTLEKTYVVPLLFEVEPTDLVGPLVQFNAARMNKEDMKKLIFTINKALEAPLSIAVVEESFELWWSKLETDLANIPKVNVQSKNLRSDRDLLEEVLSLVREKTHSPVPQLIYRYIGERKIGEERVRYPEDINEFVLNQQIYHEKFGFGKILTFKNAADKKEARIQFKSAVGTKSLLLKYANLAIVIRNLESKIEDIFEAFPPEDGMPF